MRNLRLLFTSTLKLLINKLKGLTAFAVFSVYFSSSVIANTNQSVHFDHISVASGLSDNNVFSAVQDQYGFLWIATHNALNRYDGNHFKVYRHRNEEPHSLASNLIRKVFIDYKGNLWVGTQDGLSLFHYDKDNFTNFKHVPEDPSSLADNTVFDIYHDSDNNLLISTDTGLQKYQYETQSFSQVPLKGSMEQAASIKTIAQDSNGNYWFGSFGSGIYLASSSLNQLNALSPAAKQGRIKANTLFDFSIIDGKYWLATDNGIFELATNYEILNHYTVDNTANSLVSNEVRAITEINEHTLWVGTRKGLLALDKKTRTFTDLTDTTSPRMIEKWVTFINKDNQGRILVGTWGGGLYAFNPISTFFVNELSSSSIQDKRIDSFAQTSDGTVWFSNESGELYSSMNSMVTQAEFALSIDVAQIVAVNNILFINDYSNKLYKFEVESNLLTEVVEWKQQFKHDFNLRLYSSGTSICYVRSGRLHCYDTARGVYKDIVEYKAELDIQGIGRSIDNTILLISSNGNILEFQNDKLTKLANIELNAGQAPLITGDKDWLWISQDREKLLLINKKTRQKFKFSQSNNELPNDMMESIIVDKDSRLWIAGNASISVIDPLTRTVKTYLKDFFRTTGQFTTGSAQYNHISGKVYFGNTFGLISFDPQAVYSFSQKRLKPEITSLTIANLPVKVGTNQSNSEQYFYVSQALTHTQKIEILHTQFPVKLDFISPNALVPNQVTYKYRLNGVQDDWYETDSEHLKAIYSELSAGEYIFEVFAIDQLTGVASDKRALKIHVLPPWWQSNSALAIYALIISLCCLYVLQQMRHKRQYHLEIKKSEERLKLSLWGSGDEMWDWNIITGEIFRSNIWGTLEFPQDGTRSSDSEESNIHPHDLPRVQQALEDHFSQHTKHFEETYRVKSNNDDWIWVLDRGKIVERDEEKQPTRMTGTLKDISQIKNAEERLKLFAKCIENISDAVVIYDRHFTIVDVNKAYQSITGKAKQDVIGEHFKFSRYPDSFALSVKKHLIINGNWKGELESQRHNGETYYSDLALDIIRDENNSISHFVGVFSDITARKKNEAELRKLANSDTLTGLPNRSFFQANQQRLVDNKVSHALLVFDLDNFKKINDSMGHQVGDALLVEVANRLLKLANKKLPVYRLGGDEFSLIIENTNDIHTITTLAKQILSTIAEPMLVKSQEIVLFSSIGIVLYPEDGATPQELLKNADTAMYFAKDAGGNRYQFFSDSMNKQAVKRLQVEGLIRHGLKDDLFSVFYQPKIEIKTGRVAGMEALVRFETPSKGIISPLVFIPVSEETGQIIDIGEVVLRKSCFAAKKWVDAGLFDGRVAVNLSAVQFRQPNLVSVISNILNESGLAPKYLELEITEGTVMDSPQQAIETMLQIRSMGIHLSLDDFGTGYSSLAYLKKFPLNTLKIDKAFVDDIEQSIQGRNMVATIVTIAHNLGLNVVAEGVETNNQLNFLSGLNCEQLQGYLYSKPLTEADFQRYLLSYQITDQSITKNTPNL